MSRRDKQRQDTVYSIHSMRQALATLDSYIFYSARQGEPGEAKGRKKKHRDSEECAGFIKIKQGLHDERLTRSSSGFRAEEAVSGRALGLLKTFSVTFGETNELNREVKLQLQTQKEFYLPSHFFH